MSSQSTISERLLMIRPAAFGYNQETAANNSFQEVYDGTAEEVQDAALKEFDRFVRKLQNHRIHVDVIEDRVQPYTPDAIFPNNWISFHADGKIITYPMFSALRRRERRMDLIETLKKTYVVTEIKEYQQFETAGRFLEGTGSLVLDRANRIAYACRSIRTDEDLVGLFCKEQGFQKIVFDAFDLDGVPIYHTNVIMALAETFAVICLDAIPNGTAKKILVETLEQSGKIIVNITFDQVECFAGNMLQVKNADDVRYTVMSEAAFLSLRSEQINIILKDSFIVHAAIPTIEKVGGGSVRCMMAENFLPVK